METDDSVPHIARTRDTFDVLLVGGGRAGTSLLGLFTQFDWLNLKGVVDLDEQATCMQYAQSRAIPTYIDVKDALAVFNGNLIIDVTGDEELSMVLPGMCENKNIKVVTGWSAKLIYALLAEKLHDQMVIQAKASQLQLLNTMLQISHFFRQLADQQTLLHQGLEGSAQLMVSQKAVALIKANTGFEVIGGIGVNATGNNLSEEDVRSITNLLKDHRRAETLIELDQAVRLRNSEEAFQLALPIYINQELRYLLLFQVQLPLQDETRTTLSLLLSHLELALEAERKNKLFEELVNRDPLTGIYNRRFFDERIKQEIDRLHRSDNGTLAVMFMDIDNFKELNDTHGHVVGDSVLEKISEKISESLRSYDVLARYGGDEFVALLFDIGNVHVIAERIISEIEKYQAEDELLNSSPIILGLSIGISIADTDDKVDETGMLTSADKALYTAKKSGRGVYHIVRWKDGV